MALKMTTSIAITKQAQKEIAGIIDHSRALAAKVKDDETALAVDNRILQLKEKLRNIEARFEPSRARLREAKREMDDLMKSLTDPIAESIQILKGGVNPYRDQQERDRQILQAKQQKENEEKAKADREKALKEAKEAGDKEMVQTIKQTPIYVPPVVIQKAETPLVRRTLWYAELKSIKTLCRAIVEGRAPEQAVEANMPYLNKRAVADKDKMDIPGVEPRSRTVC